MPKLYFEDFNTGDVAVYGPRLVTREEIVAFAAEFDPQPMHLDEDAASATLLGGLAASGWHACALMMRMIADGFLLDSSSMGAPGVDEVRWLRPLRPGTQVRLRATVLDTRASKSRPEMGLTRIRYDLIDDADTVITTLTSTMMLGRRAPGARRMSFFEDIVVGESVVVGRHTFTADEHQGLRAPLRSAAFPSRRGGGGSLAFRRAVRLGLAHRDRVDAADGRAPARAGRGRAGARRARGAGRPVARLARSEMVEAGLCR